MYQIPHRRRPRLESLERRHLLTTLIDPGYYSPQDSFTVRRDEAEPVELRVSFGGFDSEGDYISLRTANTSDVITEIVDAGRGSATIGAAGTSILYQPETGFVGIDLLTVLVQPRPGGPFDQVVEPVEQKIAVNVVEPLLAVDDWFQVAVDAESTELDVLANDIRNAQYIGNHQPTLTLQSITSDGGGQVALNDDQTELVYIPAAGFEGVETIVYEAVDEDGYFVQGTAQVRVSNESADTIWPERLQQQMQELAVLQHRYVFGTSDDGFVYPFERYYLTTAVSDASLPETNGDNVSGTNNQLADVDESDRVKTDGEYMYVLTSPDSNDWHGWGFLPWIDWARGFAPTPQTSGENLLTVIDIRQPDAPVIVGRHLFEDQVESLDLHENRLTVLAHRDHQTVVTALDISNPAAPQTVWTTVVDGSLKQARRVADSLYVFTNEHGYRTPELESICDPSEEFCFFETGQQYLDRVEDLLADALFPTQEVFDGEGQRVDELSGLAVDPLAVGLTEHYSRSNIITFDTGSDVGGSIDWDVTEAAQHVLVTSESIYVTRTNYSPSDIFLDPLIFLDDVPEQPTVTTELKRFALQDDGTVSFAADGEVPGTLNNSFSLDEYEGRLRIATENPWRAASDQLGSSIYVLQQTDDSLDISGWVTGLAPGESIYAVRFAQDRGYVVTFRRVDPLFVVDLSEPTEPEVLGQLKTPGYSQYLHIVSGDHLIGVGRDADEQTGLYGGLIVSLFNVSDPTNPVVQDRYEFAGGRSTFSPFAEDSPWDLRDHHAISYFADSGVLALPVYSQAFRLLDDGDEPLFDSPDVSAVQTFVIDTETGIEELDLIPFDSRADRTLRVGEHLYSLSNDELKVTNLLDPDGVIASLEFERGGEDDFVDAQVGDAVTIDVIENDGVLSVGEVQILDATLVEGEGDVEVVDGHSIRFTPGSRSLLHQRIRYTARDAAGTLIDAFATVDPDIQWQNVDNNLDVNDDEKETARDALNVMNMIHRYGGGDSEEIERQIGNADNVELFYFDTTGDGMLSAWDALLVINKLIDDTFNPNPTPVADAFFSEFADDEEELVAGEPALF